MLHQHIRGAVLAVLVCFATASCACTDCAAGEVCAPGQCKCISLVCGCSLNPQMSCQHCVAPTPVPTASPAPTTVGPSAAPTRMNTTIRPTPLPTPASAAPHHTPAHSSSNHKDVTIIVAVICSLAGLGLVAGFLVWRRNNDKNTLRRSDLHTPFLAEDGHMEMKDLSDPGQTGAFAAGKVPGQPVAEGGQAPQELHTAGHELVLDASQEEGFDVNMDALKGMACSKCGRMLTHMNMLVDSASGSVSDRLCAECSFGHCESCGAQLVPDDNGALPPYCPECGSEVDSIMHSNPGSGASAVKKAVMPPVLAAMQNATDASLVKSSDVRKQRKQEKNVSLAFDMAT